MNPQLVHNSIFWLIFKGVFLIYIRICGRKKVTDYLYLANSNEKSSEVLSEKRNFGIEYLRGYFACVEFW